MAGGYTLISEDGTTIEIQQGTTGDLNQNAGLAEGVYASNGAFLNSLSLSFNGLLGQAANPLLDGEIVIDGVPVPAANPLNDTASNTDKSASAIAATFAINEVRDQSGVTAEPNQNLINGSDMTSTTAGTTLTGTLLINGITTTSLTLDADNPEFSRLNVVNAVNAITGQTGVTAIDTGSDAAGVQLLAADGRNISYEFVPVPAIALTARLDGDAIFNFAAAPVTFTITNNSTIPVVGPIAVLINTDYTANAVGTRQASLLTDINAAMVAAGLDLTAAFVNDQLTFAADNGTDSFTIADGGNAVATFGADIVGAPFTSGSNLPDIESYSGLPDQHTVYVASVRLNASEEFSLSSTQPSGLSNHGLTFGTYGSGTDGQFVQDIDVSTVEGALDALAAVDNALQTINIQRATLGAVQNRFESTITNQSIAMENLAAANSRIKDADFAKETASLSRAQVLQQAGIAILSQANALPQQVLSLLQ